MTDIQYISDENGNPVGVIVPNKALRIINLLKDVQRDPFKGIGQPEPYYY